MPKLTLVIDDAPDIVVPFADRLTVGSAEGNDVVVDDDRLSAHHAVIMLAGPDQASVEDLGSVSGTFVNGARVARQALTHGDWLSFGPLQAIVDLQPDETPTTGTSRLPLPPQPSPNGIEGLPSEAIRKAENRLALLEAAARQAEAAHRDWLAAIDRLNQRHAEKEHALAQLARQLEEKTGAMTRLTRDCESQSAALAELNATLAASQTLLETKTALTSEADQRLDEIRHTLASEEERLEGIRRQAQEASEIEAAHRAAADAAESRLTSLKAELEAFAHAEAELATRRAAHAVAEQQMDAHRAALACLLQERESQEKALVEMETRLAAAREALVSMEEQQAGLKKHVEELRAARDELQASMDAPLEDLRRRIEKSQHDLGVIEARLRPLRDWKEAQERRLSLLASLPADSPEARELLREIEREAADLLRLMNLPPSRTPRIIQIEPPFFAGVPMKSGHIRVSSAPHS
jgi:pSer/pThr/pTyr-binding forkhead associated (FHA) protein